MEINNTKCSAQRVLEKSNTVFTLEFNDNSKPLGYYTLQQAVPSDLLSSKEFIEDMVYSSCIRTANSILYDKLNPINYITLEYVIRKELFRYKYTHIFIPDKMVTKFYNQLEEATKYNCDFVEKIDQKVLKCKIIIIPNKNSNEIFLYDNNIQGAQLTFFNTENIEDDVCINYSMIIDNPNVTVLTLNK